jgi:hypothetical protein
MYNITNQVKAYHIIPTPNRKTANGQWLITYGTIGYDDRTVYDAPGSYSLAVLREVFANEATKLYRNRRPGDGDEIVVPVENVHLYELLPASAHFDQGWVEIDDKGHEIAYDQSGII